MASRKIKLVSIGASIVALLFLSSLAFVFWSLRSPRDEQIIKSMQGSCLSAPKDYLMADDSMEGVLFAGKTYPTFENWEKCVRLQKGDVILYRYSSGGTPIARVVAALPGDHIQLVRNPPRNNWLIKINGEIYSTNGSPFYFGSAADHPISLYENAHKGMLDSQSLLIFANRPPGGRDSTEFGVVHIKDIVSIVAAYNNENHHRSSND